MRTINKILTIVNHVLPKSDNIVFYGRQKCESNQHAMIRYMIDNGYNEKHKIYLVFSCAEEISRYKDVKNVKLVTGSCAGLWHTLTAKYVFHCWGWGRMYNHPPKRQIVFDLWHGTALKTLGDHEKDYYKNSKYILAAGEFAKSYFKECFGYKEDQFYIGGYPRCDAFFEQGDVLKNFGIEKKDYKKAVLYMPTFRRASEWDIYDSDVDFPLFTEEDLARFDEYLAKKNVLFIIKPHPAQDEIQLLNGVKFKNIKVLKNKDLLSHDVQVYQLVSNADVLLTDYSSIYFDYLLTQRPIGFVIEDMAEYSGNRGFAVDNPLDYMPGEKIQSVEELQSFIDGVLAGKDDWQDERKRINDLVNADQSGDYCKKILDFVGIVK